MTRLTFPLVYLGRSCARHRSVERLVDSDECVECVGPQRLRGMQEAEERRQKDRRVHRLLHELSDGGQTFLQLTKTTGMPSAEMRRLLEELATRGLVVFGEERFGRRSRWLWSRLPRAGDRRSPCVWKESPR